jgi:hypothetical protein
MSGSGKYDKLHHFTIAKNHFAECIDKIKAICSRHIKIKQYKLRTLIVILKGILSDELHGSVTIDDRLNIICNIQPLKKPVVDKICGPVIINQ